MQLNAPGLWHQQWRQKEAQRTERARAARGAMEPRPEQLQPVWELYRRAGERSSLYKEVPEDKIDELKGKRPDEVFEIVFATNTDDVITRVRRPDQPTAKAMGGELVVELLDPATKQPNIEIYGAFMGGLA